MRSEEGRPVWAGPTRLGPVLGGDAGHLVELRHCRRLEA